MQPEQRQRIIGYFIEEGKEYLDTIEQGLLNLQSIVKDPQRLNQVFRAAHYIKGGAAMLGLGSIQQTAQRLQEAFKVLKEYPIQVDQKLESLLLRVFDTLEELLEQLRQAFDLSQEVTNQMMSPFEPVFEELNNHLKLLVDRTELITTRLTITASSETERIYLSGYCTVQAIEQIELMVSQFGGRITRRHWEQDSNDRLSIDIDVQLDMRRSGLSRLEALQEAIHSVGGTVETYRIETLHTCRGCFYYYGQCDVVCAVHPNGPEEENCRDWQPRQESFY